MNQISGIVKDDYVPSNQDILNARQRTTGIIEHSFLMENHLTFRFTDVSGQRNERRKWIHAFSGTSAIIFVVGLNSYDQQLFEDQETNNMLEGIELFHEIVNKDLFLETPIVLFLNKRDLFVERLRDRPLSVCFPDCTLQPGDDHEEYALESIRYLKKKFTEKVQGDREISILATVATDSGNMKTIWNNVQQMLVKKVLGSTNML